MLGTTGALGAVNDAEKVGDEAIGEEGTEKEHIFAKEGMGFESVWDVSGVEEI